jgi:hypothetical protein
VQTGIGPVPVQRVKLRDRGIGPEGERIRFTSAVLPIFPASHRRLLHLRRASSALAILEVA